MKRVIIFLVITAVATIVIAGLFLVVACAPEPWQTRPWIFHCAQFLLMVLDWPMTATAILLYPVGWNMPDRMAAPFFIFLFVVSGAFWASVIQMIWNRVKRKRTPNHPLHATLNPAGFEPHER